MSYSSPKTEIYEHKKNPIQQKNRKNGFGIFFIFYGVEDTVCFGSIPKSISIHQKGNVTHQSIKNSHSTHNTKKVPPLHK